MKDLPSAMAVAKRVIDYSGSTSKKDNTKPHDGKISKVLEGKKDVDHNWPKEGEAV